jgi:hypothetical protein
MSVFNQALYPTRGAALLQAPAERRRMQVHSQESGTYIHIVFVAGAVVKAHRQANGGHHGAGDLLVCWGRSRDNGRRRVYRRDCGGAGGSLTLHTACAFRQTGRVRRTSKVSSVDIDYIIDGIT